MASSSPPEGVEATAAARSDGPHAHPTEDTTNGPWQDIDTALIHKALLTARVPHDRLDAAVEALRCAGLVVVAGYYVPSSDELYSQYNYLGNAYLEGRIRVRWVMCAETHHALAARYTRLRYAVKPTVVSFAEEPHVDQIHDRIRTIMETGLRWMDTSTLFGIPVRIDPAARRPHFEIVDSTA